VKNFGLTLPLLKMSPEKISGSNIWQLFTDEYLEGVNGKIEGPQRVRVFEFDGMDGLLIQTENDRKVEVEGTDFESVVKKR
jgi:hypothetical protein